MNKLSEIQKLNKKLSELKRDKTEIDILSFGGISLESNRSRERTRLQKKILKLISSKK